MIITASMTGFAQLQRRLQSLATEEATKAGQAAIRAGAVVMKNAAVKAAPKSSKAEGSLSNRKRKDGQVVSETHEKIVNWIKVKKTRNADLNTVQTTVHIPKAYHANFAEFGSIHNAPNPFMRNAFDQNQQAIMDAVSKVLNKQLVKRGA